MTSNLFSSNSNAPLGTPLVSELPQQAYNELNMQLTDAESRWLRFDTDQWSSWPKHFRWTSSLISRITPTSKLASTALFRGSIVLNYLGATLPLSLLNPRLTFMLAFSQHVVMAMALSALQFDHVELQRDCAYLIWLNQFCIRYRGLILICNKPIHSQGKLQRAHWETRCLRREEGARYSEDRL